ncbi:MAG: hypothetical protein IAE78_19105 [Myxococcus sp.]|nr:hypothetical protein [Myxococcus sp.]
MLGRAALVCVVAGCVSGPRALTQPQLEALATRSYVGAFDEVLEATAVALQQRGLELERADLRQGTLVAKRRDGSGYAVSVRSRGDEQQVVALPVPERPLWVLDGEDGEGARWDDLEARTRALLETWREHPEWEYLPGRDLLGVLTFRARLPNAWERVEPSVSRRVMVAQRFKSRRGLNPSLVFEVSRRRPTTDARAFLLGAAEVALGAKGRLTWPDEVVGRPGAAGSGGKARVLDGAVPRAVTWHWWAHHSAAWTVQVAAICGPFEGELTCEAEWRELAESVRSPGFER